MNTNTDDIIICPLSRWYYGRVALLIGLSLCFGLYFCYDGAIGYPKKNRAVDLYEAFEAAKQGRDWQPETAAGEVVAADHLAEIDAARAAGRDGVSWAAFAAERRLPEEAPERFTAEQIRQQFHIAIGLGVFSVLGGLFLLLVRGRALRCDADSLTLPGGRQIAFSDVSTINLRKWDKGIGCLSYRDGNHRDRGNGHGNGNGSASASGSAARRVRIDDYKYAGSASILSRVCKQNPAVTIEGDRRWLWPEEENPES